MLFRSNNKFCYATMVMAGDAAELDKKKKEKIEKLRTLDLCIDDMTRVFNLTAPLKMRYDHRCVAKLIVAQSFFIKDFFSD